MSSMVSIKGLKKTAVLAALYNAAKPQGMGFLHYDPTPMTEEEAAQLIDNGEESGAYFDYLQGRVMKIRIAGDEISVGLYDRDNGDGAAAEAINALRTTGDTNAEEVELRHKDNTRNAAMLTSEHLYDETDIVSGVWSVNVHMGMADVADVMKPKLDAVLDEDEDLKRLGDDLSDFNNA